MNNIRITCADNVCVGTSVGITSFTDALDCICRWIMGTNSVTVTSSIVYLTTIYIAGENSLEHEDNSQCGILPVQTTTEPLPVLV